jgi:hypothetical protein
LLPFGGAAAQVWKTIVPGRIYLRAKTPTLWRARVGVAGNVSAILYLLAQVASNPAVLGIGSAGAASAPQPNALLVVAVVIGFIAGFTFDAVYRKLAETDVVRTEAVAAKASMAPTGVTGVGATRRS